MNIQKDMDLNYDKEAFDFEYSLTHGCSNQFQIGFAHGFKAALKHRDAQASAINEQMLEALKALRKDFGLYSNGSIKGCVDAIAAAEAHKEPKC